MNHSGVYNTEIQLCIDQGNSSTKVGIFSGNSLLETLNYEQLGENEITYLINKYNLKSVIVSSVIQDNIHSLKALETTCENFLILNSATNLPFSMGYETPDTLGKDRIAAVAGATFLKPNTDLLVIDIGTAITYDFIDSKNHYHGGNIAPGIDLRLKSLHHFTGKLPLVKPEGTESPLLGKNTRSAILSGVMQGIIFEINGYTDTLKIKYPELSVFLTGGSTFYFDTKLKNTIFAEKNLVLIGLNRILQFNVHK